MYKVLAISLTQKCSAECRMCCFGCSPSSSQKLDKEDIKRLIDEAVGTSIKVISFSGGEAFMNFKLLQELGQYAVNKGFPFTVITNGFWGKDYDEAKRRIKTLKEIGVREISLSVDKFHQEFIPISSIRNVVKACNKLNVPVTVGFGVTKSDKVGNYIDELSDVLVSAKMSVYPLHPIGSGFKSIKEEDVIKNFPDDRWSCPNTGILSVLFDGNIYPCCSQVIRDAKMNISSIDKTSIAEAIELSKNNAILFLIRVKGAKWMCNKLYNFGLEKFKEDYIISPCDVCKKIFSDQEVIDVLSKNITNLLAEVKSDKV